MPRAGAIDRLERGDVHAFPHDTASTDRLLAGQRVKQAGLANAIAPKNACHLAGLRLERHTAQRLRGAVVKVDAVDFEHRYRPRYTSITRSFSET